jgi:putative nucleotidyltransferase with HDIG domain
MKNMDRAVTKNKIQHIEGLATIPGVAKKAIELVGNPNASLAEISHFIGTDPALATKVLRMINSALYGFTQRISSLKQAVFLLGLNSVRSLILSVTVFDLMEKVMVGLWEHSVGTAIVVRLVGRKKGLRDAQEASIYGLLHDIGKIVLALQYPEDYERLLKEAKTRGVSILSVETEYFSVDHATVGGWIAEYWGFPKDLVEVIKYHHKPQLARNMKVETGITHLADIILRAKGFGFAGDDTVPPVEPAMWELIGLGESDIRDILNEMEDLLEEAEELTLQ